MPEDKSAEWQREIDKCEAIAKEIHREEMEAREKPDEWYDAHQMTFWQPADPRYRPYGV